MTRAYLAAAALIALGLGVPLAGAALDPAAPAITSSTPPSPANENNPILNGTADPNAAVTLYTDLACLVGVAGTSTADSNGDWHIPVTVQDDSSTTFYAGTAAPPSCSGPFLYVEDSTPPPAPAISSGPQGLTGSSDATFTFSDAEPVASLSCRLDGGVVTDCSTGSASYSGLVDGAHTFEVQAVDAAGNQSAAASRAWTVDTTAPPSPGIASGPQGLVGSADATFTFSDDEAGTSLSCQLDGGGFADCSSGSASYFDLPDGAHTFDVKATDAAGNASAPASRSWSIDTTPPSAPVILTGPTDPSPSSGATFTFSEGDPTASLQCQLDGGSFMLCASPQSYNGLSDGRHTFRVRAVDPVGHVSGVASYGWSIDTVHPLVTLTDKPPLVTNRTTASFSFSANRPGSTFECRLDGGAFAGCSSPKLYTGLANSSHTFAVRATSAAGTGIATTYTWTVDTVAPRTTIASTPPARSNSASANFTFTSNEPGSTFACSLDASGFTLCGSPKSYLGLGNGSHTFRVQAVDPAGNTDASPAIYTWQIANVGPATVDHVPPANVSRLRRNVGYGRLQLRWRKPRDADFDHVAVYVSTSPKSQPRTPVYSGKRQTYTNRRFKNGLYYRYLVVSYDHAENASRGRSARVPPSVLLKAPRNGRVVHSPPVLRWSAVRKATFYNVQVYYRGQKVLSAWPAKPRRALARRWTYSGRGFTLRRGTYLWYVWPAFGPKARSHYGQLLGQGTFRVR
jgi:hypothetical protein